MKNPIMAINNQALTDESFVYIITKQMIPNNIAAKRYVKRASLDVDFVISQATIPATHQQPINGIIAIRNAILFTPEIIYQIVPKTKKLITPHTPVSIEYSIIEFTIFISFLVVIILISFPHILE